MRCRRDGTRWRTCSRWPRYTTPSRVSPVTAIAHRTASLLPDRVAADCNDNPTGAPSGCAYNEALGVNQYLDSNDPMQLDMARITHAVPLSVAFGSDTRPFSLSPDPLPK